MKRFAWVCFLPVLFHEAFSGELNLDIHGAAWAGVGQIENSEYTKNTSTDYNKNWLQQSGTVVALSSKIDESWDAHFGVGVVYVHLPRGSRGGANLWYPFWVAFVPELNFNYHTQDLFLNGLGSDATFGKFQYVYNHDSKNLGNYLMNGYVYPNILISALGDLGEAPKSTTGLKWGVSAKSFKNDMILFAETDYAPFYDFSLADVFSVDVLPGVEVGAGVNFSRFIQQNGSDCEPTQLGQEAKNSKGETCQIFVPDSAGNIFALDGSGNPTDSIREKMPVSRSGTKLMGRLRLDPKKWFGGLSGFGANEFVAYSEVAVLGLKDYPVYYDNILRRMPVMFGFNFPTWGLFNLSAEMEYFASKNSSSSLGAQSGATVPIVQPLVKEGRDDWKYSINASKVLAGSFEISAMVANDHLRLGGTHNVANGLEALSTQSDWYWTTKFAYFF